MPVSRAHSDETWDVESDLDDETEASSEDSGSEDSDVPDRTRSTALNSSGKCSLTSIGRNGYVTDKCLGKGVIAISPPSMLNADSGSDSEEDLKSSIAGSSSPLLSGLKPQIHSSKTLPGASHLVKHLPPPEAAPKSSKGLVTYLRQENAWLRSALAQIQQETEKTVSRQASGEQGTLDFAHLLELAREFGEGPPKGDQLECSDWYGDDASTTGPGTISIATPSSTPRGESNLEVTELREQLSATRCELDELKALLAERDCELAFLRCSSQ